MAEEVRAPTSLSATRRTGVGPPVGDAVRGGVASPARDPLVVEIDRIAPGLVLIKVGGAIDAGTALQLRRQLLPVTLPSQNFTRLLLDLSGVSYLDQRGLDELLSLQDRWGNDVGSVELLAPSPSVVRLLHEADLDGESIMQPGAEDSE